MGALRGRDASAADELLYEEIAARARGPAAAERDDIFSLLLAARDEDGRPLTDDELRDELMTLLRRRPRDDGDRARLGARALARHPDVLARLLDEEREPAAATTSTP